MSHWTKGLSAHHFDLLDPSTEAQLSRDPGALLEFWRAEPKDWIFVDEIQKIPKLLDVVHLGISKHNIKFALTGSSARKLRRGAANLLGGRASDYLLHPFSALELGDDFDLQTALAYGTLPEIFLLKDPKEKVRALFGYFSNYLKEEVLVEQLVRKIDPFRRFLEVAAQMNGKILNFSKISRDSGVEERSVARYFQILDDTLVGLFLLPYDRSIRKRQSHKSKFYFFDPGVTRALQNQNMAALTPQTSHFGEIFEQWLVLEFHRLNSYFEKRFRFSYFSGGETEIDLVVERPGGATLLIEIKSSEENRVEDAKSLMKLRTEFKSPECYVFNNAPRAQVHEGVKFIHWKDGLKEIFL